MWNSILYNADTDGGAIRIDAAGSASCINVLSEIGSGTGETIWSGSAINVILHNTRFNKANNVNITDTSSPTGLIVDTGLIVPKLY